MPIESATLVNIATSAITAAVAVVSVIIATAALRQNSRINAEANRPYVVIYYTFIQVDSTPIPYLVIKNFGRTGAVIESVEHSPKFKPAHGQPPFINLKNHFIAPMQSMTTACNLKDAAGPVSFTITYRSHKTKWTESVLIDHSAISSCLLMKSKPSDTKGLEEIVSKAAQEIIRTRL